MLKIAEVLGNWPKLQQQLEKAKILQTEKTNRDLLDKYDNAKKISDELKAVDSSVAKMLCPTDNEIMQVKTAQRGVTALENKLCGMNITAAIKMLGGNTVEITSLRTGEKIDVTDENTAITEAVKIAVPGVMEMQLSPANVNVTDIEAQIAEQKAVIETILGKYKAKSPDDLEAIKKQIA